MTTFVSIIHVFVCLVLMFVVLLQQGKGGGMGSAFGGGSAQVFGGSGAGNILTRATAICAAIFMLTSMTLAYKASQRDTGLRARAAEASAKKKERGTLREKDEGPASSTSAAPGESAAPDNVPAPAPAADASAP